MLTPYIKKKEKKRRKEKFNHWYTNLNFFLKKIIIQNNFLHEKVQIFSLTHNNNYKFESMHIKC